MFELLRFEGSDIPPSHFPYHGFMDFYSTHKASTSPDQRYKPQNLVICLFARSSRHCAVYLNLQCLWSTVPLDKLWHCKCSADSTALSKHPQHDKCRRRASINLPFKNVSITSYDARHSPALLLELF
eukprot:Blabericola_migrator_1__4806@NODE_2523_length_2647_cov_12_498062_g1577_i0_p2_GENE_NODE_2523_length_2647_cov_12_498062_g1577_i0NODE_2523_length_2647_cov_12_498062_g1577_i0_p2_ORF_typecomplete_len127_score12_25_NODE_2523_length_2647_cov_12_498062_g1577_i013951775